MKNNHICVLLCFHNYEHIKKCFNSVYNKNIDFFIIENKSENSIQIQEFFIDKQLKGYIQFESNISNNAFNIFIQEYKSLLNQYKYITISDCDIEISSNEVFEELKKNLHYPNVGVSCVDLSLENFPYHIPFSNTWIPNGKVQENYIECRTGIHLMTIENKNLETIYECNKFLDSNLYKLFYKKNMKWVKTLKNKGYHLTWDLYKEDHPYYKFKIENNNVLWNHNNISNYITIK